MPRFINWMAKVVWIPVGLGIFVGVNFSFGGMLGASELTVAAATSLQGAFREVVADFDNASGIHTTLVFGSSGALAQQIGNGAPYDVFASANDMWVRRLMAQGRLRSDSTLHYAEGVLVLAARPGGVLTSGPGSVAGDPADADPVEADELGRLLGTTDRMIAMANPKLAPYGAAAHQVIQAAGLWERLRERVVFAGNVRQALTYLETGNVEMAFVAASLLKGYRKSVVERADVEKLVIWRPLARTLHDPIRQSLGLVAGSPRLNEARRFADFLTGPAGRAILKRYGFRLPTLPSRSIQ